MGKWGFIWLAYGVAGVVLVGYLVALWRRLGEISEELTALERKPGRSAS